MKHVFSQGFSTIDTSFSNIKHLQYDATCTNCGWVRGVSKPIVNRDWGAEDTKELVTAFNEVFGDEPCTFAEYESAYDYQS